MGSRDGEACLMMCWMTHNTQYNCQLAFKLTINAAPRSWMSNESPAEGMVSEGVVRRLVKSDDRSVALKTARRYAVDRWSRRWVSGEVRTSPRLMANWRTVPRLMVRREAWRWQRQRVITAGMQSFGSPIMAIQRTFWLFCVITSATINHDQKAFNSASKMVFRMRYWKL